MNIMNTERKENPQNIKNAIIYKAFTVEITVFCK